MLAQVFHGFFFFFLVYHNIFPLLWLCRYRRLFWDLSWVHSCLVAHLCSIGIYLQQVAICARLHVSGVLGIHPISCLLLFALLWRASGITLRILLEHARSLYGYGNTQLLTWYLHLITMGNVDRCVRDVDSRFNHRATWIRILVFLFSFFWRLCFALGATDADSIILANLGHVARAVSHRVERLGGLLACQRW